MPHNEWFERFVAEVVEISAEASGIATIREETVRTRGSTLNMQANVVAALCTDMELYHVRQFAVLWLETAEGDALTRLALDRFGVLRHGATSSLVELTLGRTDTDDLAIPQAFVVRTQTGGVRFTLDSPVYWADGDTADKAVQATSLRLGSDQNVAAGTITVLEGSLADTTVTVTNAAAAAGGNERESDDALRARCREAFAQARVGTADAIRRGALDTPQVRKAAVFVPLLAANGRPYGRISVIVGDEDGGSNAALEAAVAEVLKLYQPAGAYVDISGSTVVLEPVTVTAIWHTGQASLANADFLRNAITARVNQLVPRANPDEAEPESELDHAILHEVTPTVPGLKKLVPSIPVGTVSPSLGEVIRTTPALVTVL